MNTPETVDKIFQCLVAAPAHLDCQVSEVLAAAGMFISAILVETFTDPAVAKSALIAFAGRCSGGLTQTRTSSDTD